MKFKEATPRVTTRLLSFMLAIASAPLTAGASEPAGASARVGVTVALASETATVLAAFREAVQGVHGCDAEGKSTGPYDFAASDVVVGKSYASGRGERIVTLRLRDPAEITGGCNDGPLDDQWLPHTFAVLSNGKVRHLGSSMTLIDAGDYDGDGRSELVFAFAKYDYDGYTLFSNGFERSVSYGWIYH